MNPAFFLEASLSVVKRESLVGLLGYAWGEGVTRIRPLAPVINRSRDTGTFVCSFKYARARLGSGQRGSLATTGGGVTSSCRGSEVLAKPP